MKITITVKPDTGKAIEKEFDNVSDASTYLAHDVHTMARHHAEAKSKKEDEEQFANRKAEDKRKK